MLKMKWKTGILAALLLLPAGRAGAAYEVALSREELGRLDTFEAHTLTKADQAFAKRSYREAYAQYDAFILEFEKSNVVPYAILRKGRCRHLDDKRYQALTEYEEVLDYFPNAIKYAAAALYYIGQAHSQNGEIDKAMKAWAEMAADEDYRKHYLAGFAINSLAGNLMKQERIPEAMKYYEQVAIDFKRVNREARWAALPRVVGYYVRTVMSEPRVRKFYQDVGTFHSSAHGVPEDLDKDTTYWSQLWGYVWGNGSFNNLQVDAKKKYYKYWADRFEGRFAAWDDYQLQYINMRYAHEDDRTKWGDRLDKQFEAHQKPGDFNRVMKWIKLYSKYPQKVDWYYRKFEFEKMTLDQIWNLMTIFYDQIRNKDLARNLMGRMKLEEFTDDRLDRLARHLWSRDGEMVEDIYMRLNDRARGNMGLLEYFYWARQHGNLSAAQRRNCIPLAEQMTKDDKYAKRSYWILAEFLKWDGKYKEAIAAYRLADNPSKNLWMIVDCFLALKKANEAIAQLREIEAFFKAESSRAAYRIAHVFRDVGRKKEYISALRGVMKKYPKSGESSSAHQELEALGIKIGGATDAE